jgi:hypothetical protein
MCFYTSAPIAVHSPDRTHDKISGLLELVSVTLSLPGTSSRQEHIFDLLVDILLPRSEPGNGIVMLHPLPFAGNVGYRDRSVFR